MDLLFFLVFSSETWEFSSHLMRQTTMLVKAQSLFYSLSVSCFGKELEQCMLYKIDCETTKCSREKHPHLTHSFLDVATYKQIFIRNTNHLKVRIRFSFRFLKYSYAYCKTDSTLLYYLDRFSRLTGSSTLIHWFKQPVIIISSNTHPFLMMLCTQKSIPH